MLVLNRLISALEQQPCENKIIDEHYKKGFAAGIRTAEWRHNNAIVEIKDWQKDIHDNEQDADKHDFVFERIFEIIDEYKS